MLARPAVGFADKLTHHLCREIESRELITLHHVHEVWEELLAARSGGNGDICVVLHFKWVTFSLRFLVCCSLNSLNEVRNRTAEVSNVNACILSMCKAEGAIISGQNFLNRHFQPSAVATHQEGAGYPPNHHDLDYTAVNRKWIDG